MSFVTVEHDGDAYDAFTSWQDRGIAAIAVAAAQRERYGAELTAQVPWSLLNTLRDALDAAGLDWRAAAR